MEPPNRTKEDTKPPFFPTISTVAVSQISRTVGFHAAEPSALRSLSEVASRYIQALATSAASIATSRGRTDSNLLDIVLAIEHLSRPRGFSGASDVTRPLLMSGILKEMEAFVRSVDEIPFARAIPRKERETKRARVSPSFAQLGRVPPVRHVPAWLPEFPRSSESCGKEDGGVKKEEEWQKSSPVASPSARILPVERERVRFKLGLGLGFGKNGVCRGDEKKKKKKRVLLSWHESDEEENSGKRRELGI